MYTCKPKATVEKNTQREQNAACFGLGTRTSLSFQHFLSFSVPHKFTYSYHPSKYFGEYFSFCLILLLFFCIFVGCSFVITMFLSSTHLFCYLYCIHNDSINIYYGVVWHGVYGKYGTKRNTENISLFKSFAE